MLCGSRTVSDRKDSKLLKAIHNLGRCDPEIMGWEVRRDNQQRKRMDRSERLEVQSAGQRREHDISRADRSVTVIRLVEPLETFHGGLRRETAHRISVKQECFQALRDRVIIAEIPESIRVVFCDAIIRRAATDPA